MPISPTNSSITAGIPEQWSETFNPVAEGLIQGQNPPIATEDMTVAANQNLAAYSPVGFDASGNLIAAVAGTTQAIGLTLRAITTGAAPLHGVGILRAGRLNRDLIAWPASYGTDELKLEAFRGAPTPTNIIVVKVYQGATVAQP